MPPQDLSNERFPDPRFFRRRVSLLLPVFLISTFASQAIGQFFDRRKFTDGAQVDLKQQLEKGLFARRPEEFAFISRVIVMVNNNQISRELVESTFLWARKKRPYPFVYFQRGLKVRAARVGVRVS